MTPYADDHGRILIYIISYLFSYVLLIHSIAHYQFNYLQDIGIRPGSRSLNRLRLRS